MSLSDDNPENHTIKFTENENIDKTIIREFTENEKIDKTIIRKEMPVLNKGNSGISLDINDIKKFMNPQRKPVKTIDINKEPEYLDILSPNGVYITPLNQYPAKEMGISQLYMFLSFCADLDETKEDCAERITAMKEIISKDFEYKVIESRFAHYGIKVSFNLIAFLVACYPNPGILGLFAHAIYHDENRNPDEPYTLVNLNSMFSRGYPNEEALEHAWRSQKVKQQGFDNGIDLEVVFKASKEKPYIHIFDDVKK